MSASLFYAPRSEGSPLGKRASSPPRGQAALAPSPAGKERSPLGMRTSCPRGGLEALPPSGSPPTRPNKGLRYPGAGLDQSVSGCVAASVVSKDGK